MSTNYGDALLQALRTLLVTVPGLPATRCWLNTSTTPAPTEPFVEDGFTTFDTQFRECGPTAWKRTDATYRVSLRVPVGTGAHAISATAAAVAETFQAASGTTLTVDGNPVDILAVRTGPSLLDAQWMHWPVSISLTFDHP